MDSMWSIAPMYLAAGMVLVGMIYGRRHPGSQRARRLMAFLLVGALVLCAGTVLVTMGRAIIVDGATGLIVPLVLIVTLMVLSSITALKGLQPRPATTTADEHEGRKWSARLTLTVAVFVALMAYGAGFLAGYWISQLKPELEGMNLILGTASAVVVGLTLVPWVVVKYRAARRRRAVAIGHPASAEGVEHVMKKATAARLAADLGSYSFNPSRVVIFGGLSIVAILALPALVQLLFTTVDKLPRDSSSSSGIASIQPSIDYATMQTIAIACALLLVLAGLIGYMLTPLLLDVRVEYQLAALSPQQRLQWESEQRSEFHGGHAFPLKLMDADRSIRVLTVTAAGDVQLEQLPAGTLLRMRSQPVLAPSDAEQADLEFVEDLDEGLQSVSRVLLSLQEHMGSREFDLFGEEPASTLHIVAVGADDYLDFPEDLAAKLIAAA
ncbi:hypothetical protein ACH3VR_23110 [Microbacterium sp. B2969]|uniref:Uncharacterized protein n=1 Tax=Microbacterium alkaliflavum TaxID=3248839 RepID=A0ABW7QEU4_9MICO